MFQVDIILGDAYERMLKMQWNEARAVFLIFGALLFLTLFLPFPFSLSLILSLFSSISVSFALSLSFCQN